MMATSKRLDVASVLKKQKVTLRMASYMLSLAAKEGRGAVDYIRDNRLLSTERMDALEQAVELIASIASDLEIEAEY